MEYIIYFLLGCFVGGMINSWMTKNSIDKLSSYIEGYFSDGIEISDDEIDDDNDDDWKDDPDWWKYGKKRP
jgi:hypothetical protein